jgi:hypothetical protein
MKVLTCKNCNSQLTYGGEMAAPGYGQCWKCTECKHSFVKIGTSLIDCATVPKDEEPPWLMELEDCV